jgi:hypothetical protein
MMSVIAAALVREQAPRHAHHVDNRAPEVLENIEKDRKVQIRCSCNTLLTLSVPTVEPEVRKPQVKPAANKVVGDGS